MPLNSHLGSLPDDSITCSSISWNPFETGLAFFDQKTTYYEVLFWYRVLGLSSYVQNSYTSSCSPATPSFPPPIIPYPYPSTFPDLNFVSLQYIICVQTTSLLIHSWSLLSISCIFSFNSLSRPVEEHGLAWLSRSVVLMVEYMKLLSILDVSSLYSHL